MTFINNSWLFFAQVKLLFASERILCDKVFKGNHGSKDHCFAAVTSKSLLTLLSFGEAIAKSKSSPEKVFSLLDMFEATLEIQSEVNFLLQMCSHW
jgi:exocyst complex protein 7